MMINNDQFAPHFLCILIMILPRFSRTLALGNQHQQWKFYTVKHMKAVLSFLALILCSSPVHATAQDAATHILFENVNVFDGINDTLHENTKVLVENNLIKSVGPSILVPTDAEVIDGGGRTLMPGLIDAHVHLLYSSTPDSIPAREAMRWDQLAVIGVVSAKEFLAEGFTTVRDAGAMYDGIKRMVDVGYIEGPRSLSDLPSLIR